MLYSASYRGLSDIDNRFPLTVVTFLGESSHQRSGKVGGVLRYTVGVFVNEIFTTNRSRYSSMMIMTKPFTEIAQLLYICNYSTETNENEVLTLSSGGGIVHFLASCHCPQRYRYGPKRCHYRPKRSPLKASSYIPSALSQHSKQKKKRLTARSSLNARKRKTTIPPPSDMSLTAVSRIGGGSERKMASTQSFTTCLSLASRLENVSNIKMSRNGDVPGGPVVRKLVRLLQHFGARHDDDKAYPGVYGHRNYASHDVSAVRNNPGVTLREEELKEGRHDVKLFKLQARERLMCVTMTRGVMHQHRQAPCDSQRKWVHAKLDCSVMSPLTMSVGSRAPICT